METEVLDIPYLRVEQPNDEHAGLMDVDDLSVHLATQSAEESKDKDGHLDKGIAIHYTEVFSHPSKCLEIQDVESNLQSPIKSAIQILQENIIRLEAQLSKVSVRREFLGRDGIGRLYWALSRHSKHPWLVVEVPQAQNKGMSLAENENVTEGWIRPYQRECMTVSFHYENKLFSNTLLTLRFHLGK